MTVQIDVACSFTYGNMQMNIYHANNGEGLLKHSHTFAHATICNAGSCEIYLEGRSYIINKYSKPLNLPAGEWHEIKALEDETVFVNVFAKGKN